MLRFCFLVQASIALVGVPGSYQLSVSGLEKTPDARARLFVGTVEDGEKVNKTVTVTNTGDSAAFVKLLCVEGRYYLLQHLLCITYKCCCEQIPTKGGF